MLPDLQIVYNSLTVTKDTTNKKVTIAFRPNNCTVNLQPNDLRQTDVITV